MTVPDRSTVPSLKTLAVLLVCFFAWQAKADTRLLMFEQEGCHFCERWLAEIGDRYHLTDEGKRAPLQRVMLGDTLPEGFSASDISVTPTFVLVNDGREVARLVGYQGDEFFWIQMQDLLEKLPRPNS